MKIQELTFSHKNCGGVIVIRRLLLDPNGQLFILGLCRACHAEVPVKVEIPETPPKCLFSEEDDIRVHGFGIAPLAQILLTAS